MMDTNVAATGLAHSIAGFVTDRPAIFGDATKAWDLLHCKPTKSLHDIVVNMVDSDLLQERDA
jgi:GDP-D-mannose dehydratase